MQNIWLTTIMFLYAATGVISTIGYIPTIKDLWYKRQMSANVSSYFIWTFCTIITLIYSIFILPDMLFQIVSLLNFVCCAIILALSLALQIRNERNHNKS